MIREPPTGTVTLLFTDIEGSTRLWESVPAGMKVALARHDQLLRDCIDGHGGHVFKTVGDAFCAVFTTSSSALAAALDAQRALHREPWPDGTRLRVRMAVHAGAVERREDDYFGAPLNRVARLLAAGHGGQTLMSESAYDLCRDHLPPLVTAKPLGSHGLKDLGRPEQVYQACHPDIPATFPPLRSEAAPPAADDTPSIAVLPFVNMSRDDENEYFADGLSEELLNVLAKIRGLRVASRTSAFSFKGKDVDIPTIAAKLNVATVLEGSVRKSGKRVRITAQLIEVSSDSHLWSETYDRELDDIFAVQDDIAQSVVKELRHALMGAPANRDADRTVKAEVDRAVTGRSDDPEAFQLYLQGRFFGERITQADTDKAIALLERAVAIDPGFALAWAELARAHRTQAGYGFSGIEEGYERSRAAAERGLALAPDLPEALVGLALVCNGHDWNFDKATELLQRALALAPGNASVLQSAASNARMRGRTEESDALLSRAIALDPLSARVHRESGIVAFSEGRFEAAARAFQLTLDLNPKAGLVQAFIGVAQLMLGHPDQALEIAQAEPHDVFRNLAVAMIQHARGEHAASDAALEALIQSFGWTAAFQIGEAYAYRGEPDKAFEWLERACEQRDPGILFILRDHLLRSLHADPRWLPLVRRVGLPELPDRTTERAPAG
jgi:TolB-like protein/class 3 adenylate cyclase/tetratricopeptide (TPR) repeat protein